MKDKIQSAIDRLDDLKDDRKSFLSGEADSDEIYTKDIQAIDTALAVMRLVSKIINSPELISKKPRLTEDQKARLTILTMYGTRWLIKDKDGKAWAVTNKPKKGSSFWVVSGRPSDNCLRIGERTEIYSLVSWEDQQPLNVVKTLQNEGEEVIYGD